MGNAVYSQNVMGQRRANTEQMTNDKKKGFTDEKIEKKFGHKQPCPLTLICNLAYS